MDNLTEILSEELFEAESEEQFIEIIKKQDFANFGSELHDLLSFLGIDKKSFINILLNSPFGEFNEDSVRKKVDNWLNNRNRMDRDTAFQICILLKLTLDQSKNFFYKALGEKWVHHRNVKDVIYDFCIRNSLPIEVAKKLLDDYDNSICNISESIKPTTFLKEQYENLFLSSIDMNSIMRFISFLDTNLDNFNQTRGTLHKYFVSMLRQNNLFCGDKLIKANKNIDTNFLSEILMDTDYKNTDDNAIKAKKSLRVLLDKYVSGQMEVPRHIFIKCMLIAGVDDLDTMNHILTECGINELYPRNKFDAWICDALIHSEPGLSYCRLTETFDAFKDEVIIHPSPLL